MDLRQIKNLMKEFEDSTIHRLEITEDNFSIKLEKEDKQTFSNIPSVPAAAVAAVPVATSEVGKQENDEENNNIKVTAPLVGTFYQSPSPDSKPFVSVNQKVNKGDTLFIIEAMKVMNEINSPVSGTVVKIHVSDAALVEYGQVVMEIQE